MGNSFEKVMKNQGIPKELRSDEHFFPEVVKLGSEVTNDARTEVFAIPREILFVQGAETPSILYENGAVVSIDATVDDSAYLLPRSIVGGYATVGAGATIEDGARIDVIPGIRPSVIDSGTKIGKDSIVSGSLINEDAEVGLSSKVIDSEVGSKTVTAFECKINQSKIEDNCTLAYRVNLEGLNVVGEGTVLEGSNTLEQGATTGKGCRLKNQTILRNGATLGDGVNLGSHVEVQDKAIIKEDTVVGHATVIGVGAVVGLDFDEREQPLITTIGRSVRIENKAIIESGVTLPNGCRVLENTRVMNKGRKIKKNTIIYPPVYRRSKKGTF